MPQPVRRPSAIGGGWHILPMGGAVIARVPVRPPADQTSLRPWPGPGALPDAGRPCPQGAADELVGSGQPVGELDVEVRGRGEHPSWQQGRLQKPLAHSTRPLASGSWLAEQEPHTHQSDERSAIVGGPPDHQEPIAPSLSQTSICGTAPSSVKAASARLHLSGGGAFGAIRVSASLMPLNGRIASPGSRPLRTPGHARLGRQVILRAPTPFAFDRRSGHRISHAPLHITWVLRSVRFHPRL